MSTHGKFLILEHDSQLAHGFLFFLVVQLGQGKVVGEVVLLRLHVGQSRGELVLFA